MQNLRSENRRPFLRRFGQVTAPVPTKPSGSQLCFWLALALAIPGMTHACGTRHTAHGTTLSTVRSSQSCESSFYFVFSNFYIQCCFVRPTELQQPPQLQSQCLNHYNNNSNNQ
ncbi:hypothetical protein ACLKA7_014432 [Drosophila subpalustris]